MGKKVWVLDTGTKGTGASVVPLESTQVKPKPTGDKLYVPPKPRPKPPKAPEPRAPRRFQVVDVVTGETLAEHVDTRATLDVLRSVRSNVDVRVSVWDPKRGSWRLLGLGEQRALWNARRDPRSLGAPGGALGVVSAAMTDEDPLEQLSSKELHDLAVSHAKRHLDVKFFWRLMQMLPTAEAAAGEVDEAADDVQSVAGHLDDLTDSGEGEVADLLRPFYIEYLREHGVRP